MSDDPQQPQAAGGDGPPRIQINAQYLKDLSFENPNAPQSLVATQAQPKIQVSVDVGARGMGNNRYEVELRISGKASRDEQTAFVVELQYAGLFTLHNVDADTVKLVCLIECPRLLFPFARRVIADATRDGGFPPLLLEPIDFAALYRQQEQRQQQPGDGAAPGPA
jgi:preprotein translocase subunit SecB